MAIHDDLPSLYAYNRWADSKMFEEVRKLSPEQYAAEPAPGWASVRSTVIHMGAVLKIWANRLGADIPSLTAAPTESEVPTVDAAEQLFQDGYKAFDSLLAAVTPERLASIETYRNLKGEAYLVPVWAVYRHVVNHATYHRGQVAAKLKRLGVEPPKTDLVFWALELTPQEAS
jgi:uncharacterized damage-inducible protein DinB